MHEAILGALSVAWPDNQTKQSTRQSIGYYGTPTG
jgi:hypothetical protein